MFDALMEEEYKRLKEADASVPEGMDLKVGDHFMYVAYGSIAIFGYVVEVDKEDVGDLYSEPHMKNFRFAHCFSEACPEGEYGDIHLSVVKRKITREDFEEAKRMGWMVG